MHPNLWQRRDIPNSLLYNRQRALQHRLPNEITTLLQQVLCHLRFSKTCSLAQRCGMVLLRLEAEEVTMVEAALPPTPSLTLEFLERAPLTKESRQTIPLV